MKKYNIILANAPIKNGNRGCVALSITMMSLIDEVMNNSISFSSTHYLMYSQIYSIVLHYNLYVSFDKHEHMTHSLCHF